ncbi:uncharacterized protein A4U43_C10F18780 [Asparagus officinalis]|uniref:Protein MIS12 homolog n=1 Tax=Asparagus officinalis TaxID=4686 RepID=A0A5P1E3T8_ASPOF|nr:protein MIS12 homolog isoform X2 [Asparagus officinalis]ONK57312.1 uncharacterized protein A4U43_C10F18780 [Asparagus officinalis]
MEGSMSEAAFDAQNLNPRRFINEILNSVDDIIDGAFGFALEKASEITDSGDSSGGRSEELARGVSAIRQLTQGVLDKRMEMWEKYCLRHCFSVPEGFVLPTADSSSDSLLFQEGLDDGELDSQLGSLRNKLAAAGMKSVELQKEIRSLDNQSTLSHSLHSYVAEAIELFEQNSADKMFQEIGETASKLQAKIEEVKTKRKGDKECTRIGLTEIPCKKQHMARNLGIPAKLKDIQEVANILRNM